MVVVRQLLLSTLLITTTAALTGPPAAQPPDLESLQRSFHEDEPVELKRVIITKPTTKSIEETTVASKRSTERSEFADNNFSKEVEEGSKEQTTIVKEETTTEKPIETTEETTITTESTTEPTTEETRLPKRLEIKKIVRTTTPQPPPEDRLTRIEELRLLKKLSQKGIAFGVKTKELEVIHNAGDELELPPFAFSEDENVVNGGSDGETSAPSTTAEPTTTPEAPTTKKPVSTTPSESDIEFLEKELARYKEEPFKVGTNIFPQHLFFDQNSMGIHKRRIADKKKLDSEFTDKAEELTTRVPAVMQPFISSLPPRVDDFLVPRPEKRKEESEDEQKLDSFNFATPIRVSRERTTMSPPTKDKKKLPEKMVLPILLEMPHLSSLSSFGSLAVPVHPSGVSQRIHSVRLDSEAQVIVSPKNKTSGRMIPKRRRRLFRRKTAHAVITKPLEGVTVSKEEELIKKIRPPRIIIKQHKQKKTIVERLPAPITATTPIVIGSPKIIRTHDVAAQEQAFAQSLTSRGSTMDLVVDSLKKMKKVTRLILKKNSRARARAAGKTVQAVRLHSHDGERKAVVKVDGNTDDKIVVVDRDRSRKTIDRDV